MLILTICILEKLIFFKITHFDQGCSNFAFYSRVLLCVTIHSNLLFFLFVSEINADVY